MNDLAPPATVAPRRKWPRYVVAVLLLAVGVTGGLLAFVYWIGQQSLQAAMDEADRLDPGWRLDDLEAAREQVPDAENAALQVLRTTALLPKGWMTSPPGKRDALPERLFRVPDATRLDDEQAKELRAELAKVGDALDAARKVAAMPRGRYPLNWSADAVGTLVPHLERLRDVARLLQLDVMLRVHDGDRQGADESFRALVNAARSVGDEPLSVSQLRLAAAEREAYGMLERWLAQEELPPATLAALQKLLEPEQPSHLIAARSERAICHQFLMVTRAGKLDRANYGMRSNGFGAPVDRLVDARQARAGHAPLLRHLTELVEIAKLPPDRQFDRLKAIQEPDVTLPVLLTGLRRGGSPNSLGLQFVWTTAIQRCTCTALALERFRRDNGHWPATLNDLVPRYLAAVPLDPFNGQLLRYRMLPDGVVIYAVGSNQTDDNGRSGHDVTFTLWNADKRRQAPKTSK